MAAFLFLICWPRISCALVSNKFHFRWLFLSASVSYLLYGVPNDITRDMNRLLANAYGAGNGLSFDTGVPLRLEDEDASRSSKVQTMGEALVKIM